MNWKEFTDYLTTNILELKEETTQEEYQLTEKAKESIPSVYQNTLLTELESLLLLSYEQRFDIESSYHKLPEIEVDIEKKESDKEEITEETRIKTWKELFPRREDCLFGRTSQTEPPPETIYLILGKIYEDWRQQREKTEQLTEQAQKWKEESEKLMKEWVSQQAREFFKKRGLNVIGMLKQWLKDYESLGKEQKQELKEAKKQIEEAVDFLGTKVEKETQEPKPSWYSNIPWGQVVKYGGGGLLIIIGLAMVLKFIKGEK